MCAKIWEPKNWGPKNNRAKKLWAKGPKKGGVIRPPYNHTDSPRHLAFSEKLQNGHSIAYSVLKKRLKNLLKCLKIAS